MFPTCTYLASVEVATSAAARPFRGSRRRRTVRSEELARAACATACRTQTHPRTPQGL